MIDVARQLPLVCHELVPIDVSRVGILKTDRPLGRGDRNGADPAARGAAAQRIRPPPPINIGAGVGGVLQYVQDAGAVRRAPDHLVWRRTAQRPHRQQQIAPPQISHHRLGTAQFPELREHQTQPLLHLLVRIECDRAVAGLHEPRRKRHPQFAPRRFLALTLM